MYPEVGGTWSRVVPLGYRWVAPSLVLRMQPVCLGHDLASRAWSRPDRLNGIFSEGDKRDSKDDLLVITLLRSQHLGLGPGRSEQCSFC